MSSLTEEALPREQQNLMVIDHDDGYVGGAEEEFIEPLFLSIKKETGMLTCEQEEAEYEDMTVSIARMHSSCELYPEKFKRTNPLLCYSKDGRNPSCKNPLCGPDAGPNPCLGEWKKIGGKNVKVKPCDYGNFHGSEKPRCQEVERLLVYEVGEGTCMPYWFSVKSLGLSSLRAFMKKLNRKVQASMIPRKRAGLPRPHSSMFQFKLSSAYHESDKGNSYQPTFSGIEPIAEDIEELILEISELCRNTFYEKVVDDEAIENWRAEERSNA